MTEKPAYEDLEHRVQEFEKSDYEHRKVEKELKQNNVMLESIINGVSTLINYIDCEERYMFVNQAYADWYGVSREELLGKKIADVLSPDVYKRASGNIKKALGGQQVSYENKVIAKDGSERYVSTNYDPHYRFAEVKGFFTTIIDITERIHAEKALRESKTSLQSVFEAVPVGICFMKNRVYQRVNRNWCERFGYPEESLLGRTTEFLYENKKEYDRVGKTLDEQIIEHGIALVHTRLKRSDGEFRDVDLIAKPLNSQNIADGTVVAVHDITEQKQAEKEKLTAQKIASKNEKLALVGQIAGKMAHDFNNILGIIMGNTELALVDCPDDQTKKRLELIYNQTIRGKNLTKNLIAFAKDQEPKQEFFSIDEKMDLVLNLLKKDLEGIHVIRQYGHGKPELLADSGMIEHAIVNLVQNSIHAVSLVERPEIIVHTYHQGELIFIEIEDNGCGIPPEFLGEIYEPSFTLKGSKDKTGMYKPGIKGTGYGMSNVKKYIEQHKGNISILSEFQKGTKVIITLPVVKKELTDDEIADVKKEKIYFEKYILLVEDEQAISDVQYSILTHEPCRHKVDIANSGQAALDLLNTNAYDLISLDYILPGNFNGMDIYHHVRETNKNIPILFISGNIDFLESIKDLKKTDPYIDHLSKPCKNIDYINCINKLFGSISI